MKQKCYKLFVLAAAMFAATSAKPQAAIINTYAGTDMGRAPSWVGTPGTAGLP